jgi:hypothetical protein
MPNPPVHVSIEETQFQNGHIEPAASATVKASAKGNAWAEALRLPGITAT